MCSNGCGGCKRQRCHARPDQECCGGEDENCPCRRGESGEGGAADGQEPAAPAKRRLVRLPTAPRKKGDKET